jgi:hypothetical protein
MISMKADPSHSNWTIFGYFSVCTGNGFQISQGSFLASDSWLQLATGSELES